MARKPRSQERGEWLKGVRPLMPPPSATSYENQAGIHLAAEARSLRDSKLSRQAEILSRDLADVLRLIFSSQAPEPGDLLSGGTYLQPLFLHL